MKLKNGRDRVKKYLAGRGWREYERYVVPLEDKLGLYRSEVRPGAPLGATGLRGARTEQNITVVRSYFRIDDFVDADLSPAALAAFETTANNVRQAGAKIIPRFAYNFGREGTDAPQATILRHIEQLAPLLQEHADVIACMEAGFIGAWGEWHSSDFNLDNTDSRRAVLFALMDALPQRRMVAVRYAGFKRDIFANLSPLGPDSAFCGSFRARTGADGRTLHVPGRLTAWRRVARAGDAVAIRVAGAGPRCAVLLDAGGRRVACMAAAADRQHVLTVRLPGGLRPGLYTMVFDGARYGNAAVAGLVLLPQN